jgi:hypothetical protein
MGARLRSESTPARRNFGFAAAFAGAGRMLRKTPRFHRKPCDFKRKRTQCADKNERFWTGFDAVLLIPKELDWKRRKTIISRAAGENDGARISGRSTDSRMRPEGEIFCNQERDGGKERRATLLF